MSNSRGSVLIITLFVLMAVLGLIMAGSSYYLTFANEANTLDASLSVRHLAYSGLVYHVVAPDEINQWITLSSGKCKLEIVKETGSKKLVRCIAELTGNPRHQAIFTLMGNYQRSGSTWSIVSADVEGDHR